jgi:hypothetical protein
LRSGADDERRNDDPDHEGSAKNAVQAAHAERLLQVPA